MPLRPAANITENARYGLHAGSGDRNSMRVELSLPFLVTGTRTSADRLFRAQQTYTGASYRTLRRLYELTHWFVTAVISRAWCSSPAMKHFPTLERPRASLASWKAFTSPSKSDRWVCIPEPKSPEIGFGMNVAYAPTSAAIFFTTWRNEMTLSAIVHASVYRRSISCWLGPSSGWLYSTGMPIASRVTMVCLRRFDTRSVVRSKNPA